MKKILIGIVSLLLISTFLIGTVIGQTVADVVLHVVGNSYFEGGDIHNSGKYLSWNGTGWSEITGGSNATTTQSLPFSNITTVPGIGSYSYLISANDPVTGNYSARFPNGSIAFTSTDAGVVINQARASSVNPVIEFTNQIFLVNNTFSPIIIDRSTVLRGTQNGWSPLNTGTIIKARDSTKDLIQFSGSSTTYNLFSQLQYLTIDGSSTVATNPAAPQETNALIHFINYTQDLTIDHCTISNSTGYGILFNETTYAHNIWIQNSWLEYINNAAIAYNGGGLPPLQKVHIINNNFDTVGKAIWSNSTGGTVSGTSYLGANMWDISFNTISTAIYSGFYLEKLGNSSITNNKFTNIACNGGTSAIDLLTCTDNMVTHNTFTSQVGTVINGIVESGSSDYNTISNNDVRFVGSLTIRKMGANTIDHPNMGYTPTATYIRSEYIYLYNGAKLDFTSTDMTTRNQYYDPPWTSINTTRYPAAAQYFLEIVGYKSEAGIIYCDLWDHTDNAVVAGSNATLTNAAPKATGISQAFTPYSGYKEYYARLAVNNGTGNIFAVAIRVQWLEIAPI